MPIARESKRYKVLTKNTYGKTVMKESQTAAMVEFIDNVRILINALGYNVLEPTVHNDPNYTVDDEALFLNLGNVSGKGMVTTEGFVLFAGAVLNEKTKAGCDTIVKTRKKGFQETAHFQQISRNPLF